MLQATGLSTFCEFTSKTSFGDMNGLELPIIFLHLDCSILYAREYYNGIMQESYVLYLLANQVKLKENQFDG